MSRKNLFLNIALPGEASENDETSITNLFIRCSLMNLAVGLKEKAGGGAKNRRG
jgi:hypothetical protein